MLLSAYLQVLLFTIAVNASIQHELLPKVCNSLNPRCGLTSAEAQSRYLTSYSDLILKLNQIKRNSKVPISVGPLIRNDGHNGLFDIDIPVNKSLDSIVNTKVCGDPTVIPTIRDAIICTVTRDTNVQPPRGNTDPNRIGFSTQGKILWAVRLGNAEGKRVFVATQLHGNEAASTEAALQYLSYLTTNDEHDARKVLTNLDIVFLIRANPDGGEPTANNNPQFGKPYLEKAGFFRHNVDPSAGGGFTAPTEADFSGIVGRGYDLNRYNYAAFDRAIRPVECQALVAAFHTFRPDIIFDLHGDTPKVSCDLDPTTFIPNDILGTVPTIKCKSPANPVPTLLTQRENMILGGFFASDSSTLEGNGTASLKTGPQFVQNTRLVRSIAAQVTKELDPLLVGNLSRFNAFQSVSSVTQISGGTLDVSAMYLSAVGTGWEVVNFAPSARPAVSSLAFVDGKPNSTIALDSAFLEACFLEDNICIHREMLQRALYVTSTFIYQRMKGDNGFCAIPLEDGIIGKLPTSAGFNPETARDELFLAPSGGQYGQPTTISGRCAGDP